MSKPMVAIVGRANVGKSTLFNLLCGSNLSIVKDTPGVTRDRIYADSDWNGKEFILVDTGGIEPASEDVIMRQMREQAEMAVEMANVIIFMVDVKDGLTDIDYEVAEMLRRSKKPVVVCVNKVDSFKKQMDDTYEFYSLGLGDPVPVSAAGRLGIGELLDEVTGHFPEKTVGEEEDDSVKIAIIGRPNAGKSSIVNRLLGENRMIVSDVAGTTRDAVDSTIMHNKQKYTFIDTAGLRRKSKIKEDVERYSIIRAVAAVDRSDIVVLVIDAVTGVGEQDAKIAGIAHERGKGLIIAVNKWDAVPDKDDKTMNKFTKELRSKFPFAQYADIMYVSALTGQRLIKLYDEIDKVRENQTMRVPTGVLNEIVSEAAALQQPPSDKGKRLRIYYTTQVSVKPPTFIFFVNSRELFHFSYQRYIENKFREAYGFWGTPIHFIIRERDKKEQDN
ncbi:MAG: ribosome biogenesis GTPase Der [Lachnospiraceae bacterium]|nr:ribosome biogenesis GTPase Der [Lachnospiraceae bacterium]